MKKHIKLLSRELYIENLLNLSQEDGFNYFKNEVLNSNEIVLIGEFSEQEVCDISSKFGFCAMYKTKEDFEKQHVELE